jgi:hypothetical protein
MGRAPDGWHSVDSEWERRRANRISPPANLRRHLLAEHGIGRAGAGAMDEGTPRRRRRSVYVRIIRGASAAATSASCASIAAAEAVSAGIPAAYVK